MECHKGFERCSSQSFQAGSNFDRGEELRIVFASSGGPKKLRDFDSSTRKDLVRLGPRIVFGCDVKDSFLATYFHILPSLDIILFQSFFIHIIYIIIYVYNHTIYIYIYVYIYRKSH